MKKFVNSLKQLFKKIITFIFWPFKRLMRAISKKKGKSSIELFFDDIARLKALKIDFEATYDDGPEKIKASRKLKAR